MSINMGGGDVSVSGEVENLETLDRYRSDFNIFQATLSAEFDTDGSGGQEIFRIKTDLQVPNLDRGEIAELVMIRPERFDMFVTGTGIMENPQSGFLEGSLFWPYSKGTQEESDYGTDDLNVTSGLTQNTTQTLGRVAWNLDEVWRGQTNFVTGFVNTNGEGGGGHREQPSNLQPINYRHNFGRGPLTGPAVNESAWAELGMAMGGTFENQEAYTVGINFSIQCFCDIWEVENRSATDVRRSNG